MLCQGNFIDETGAFIAMLDETQRKINFFAIEWKYSVEKPLERRKMSTIESLDAMSDKGEISVSKSAVVGASDKKMSHEPYHPKTLMPTKKNALNGKKLKGDKSPNKDEVKEKPKSKLCAIF